MIRPIDALDPGEIELVATRMHRTLVEVLGQARADEMFSHDELVARVQWHLEPGRKAAVFVAQAREGAIIGHTIVRVDEVDEQLVGLFATTYVDPSHRRQGLAGSLLERGEAWMREQGMARAVTYTDPGNTKLLALYAKHGYEVTVLDADWATARKDW